MFKRACEKMVAGLEKELENSPNAKQEINLVWAKNVLKCFEGNQPVSWLGFNFPPEIPLALGYLTFYPEIASGMLSGFNLSGDLLEFVERKYSNMFCCSFHRCAVGADAKGMWPKPSSILSVSNICDGQIKLMNIFGERHQIKPLVLEAPFMPDSLNQKSADYIEGQFKIIIPQLERISGQTLSEKRLLEVIKISNRSRSALMRLNELRKRSPAPFHGPRAINSLYVLITQLWGLPEVPDLIENLIKEIETSPVRSSENQEKFRLLIMIPPPTFKTQIYNWLEKEMGSNMVMTELTDVTWEEIDEEIPLKSLARKVISQPILGTIEKRIDWVIKSIKDYNVDGVIHFSHWGCRQSIGGVGVIQKALEDINIPFLNLDVDLVDPRPFSPGQIYTRIQSFIEMLSQRKEEAL